MTRHNSKDTNLLKVWQQVCEGEEERFKALVEHVVQRVLE